jgi:hypothetical protein
MVHRNSTHYNMNDMLWGSDSSFFVCVMIVKKNGEECQDICGLMVMSM